MAGVIIPPNVNCHVAGIVAYEPGGRRFDAGKCLERLHGGKHGNVWNCPVFDRSENRPEIIGRLDVKRLAVIGVSAPHGHVSDILPYLTPETWCHHIKGGSLHFRIESGDASHSFTGLFPHWPHCFAKESTRLFACS